MFDKLMQMQARMPRDFELVAQLAILELKVDVARVVEEAKSIRRTQKRMKKSSNPNGLVVDSETSGEGNCPYQKSTAFR